MTVAPRAAYPTFEAPARLGLWTVLVVSLIVAAPGLYPGFWQTVEGFVPVFNVAQPAALANSAVTPDFWRGTGIGALLPAQPLLLLGASALTATRLALVTCLVIGPLATYAWLRPRLGDRSAAVGAIAYACLPASLAAVYHQGSLSDVIFLALLPLALLGLSTYAATNSPTGAAVAVATILWMARAQVGLSLLAALLLALYGGLVERHRGAVLTVVVAQVAALLWLYPLWNVHAEPVTPFAAQFVTLFGLLRSGWRVGDPLQYGTMAFVLSALAIWALATGLLRRETPAYRLTLFALVTSLALFALTLPWSRLLWEATGAQNLLRSPIQLAILAAPFVAAACAGAVLALESLRRPALWASLVLLIVLSAAADLLPTYTTVAPAATPAATFGDNDLIVLNAAVSEQADPRQAQLTVTWQALRPLDFDANVFFQALGGEDAPTVVAQLDTAPVADAPSTTWQPGMIYTGAYTLDLPAEIAGPMTYYFGLYDWRDGTRLPVNAGLDDKMLFHGQ